MSKNAKCYAKFFCFFYFLFFAQFQVLEMCHNHKTKVLFEHIKEV